LKEANGNLKKVRLPPTKEELAEQEAELAAWEARKREILQGLSGVGNSPSGHQQVNEGAAQGQGPQQASEGARGTGTGTSGSGVRGDPTKGAWGALACLVACMATFVGFIYLVYTP
jgi:membrane protein involved in colicin uptake